MAKFIYYTEHGHLRYPIGEHLEMAIKYIDEIVPHLKEIVGDERLNLWCMGSSGAICAALLAKSINNQIIICHVKKEGERSHQEYIGERHEGRGSWNIIIDDFARSCTTIQKVYKGFRRIFPRKLLDILILANGDDDIPNFKMKYCIIDRETGEDWENSINKHI